MATTAGGSSWAREKALPIPDRNMIIIMEPFDSPREAKALPKFTKIFTSISTTFQSISSTRCRSMFSILIATLPSFLANLIKNPTPSDKKRRETQKILALDGLRGVACLFVFHAHYSYSFSNCLEEAPTEQLRDRIMYQPYMSLLWSGVAMVDVFFFISGYVLASRPLRLIRSQQVSKALSAISSAVFRRALRLYLPSMALIVLVALMTHLRFFEAGNNFYWQAHIGKVGPQEPPPPYFTSFWDQIWDALMDCYRMFDNTIPWGAFNVPYTDTGAARPQATIYDPHLWTIPVEFKCSMLIFMMLTLTAPLRTSWRMTINGGLGLNCLFTERFAELLFIAGMFFAEIDMIRAERHGQQVELDPSFHQRHNYNLPPARLQNLPFLQPIMSRRNFMSNLLGLAMFILGLFFLSTPSQSADVYPQFQTVLSWVPTYIQEKDDFVRVIGAIMTTWPVATSNWLAPLFSNSVAHYLGQISFALYLVHGAVIKSLWYWLQPIVNEWVAGKPVWAMPSGPFIRLWLIGYVIVLPTVLWSADIFWRVIDQRCVALARWVESKAV
ncbi:hypothetical protein PV10_03664 [Exophiala mesophila]|uniref:Acyltransferase 3 domain-containing protein n=1 Tax=Exophiala mesophila TaxID=212818 RepID=A0A0D1ZQ63_EXOME|nr:uncharacterized protein PV10_03664 [Exophiala mesophila]KIV96084.1 hypothetical protein PV10_03664 [Exophiala mesophila]